MYTTYRSGSQLWDARKADVGSQSADTIKFCFRSPTLACFEMSSDQRKETAPARGSWDRSLEVPGGRNRALIPMWVRNPPNPLNSVLDSKNGLF
jgi:hypothetical protein